jgi:hypothetical protein
MNNNTWTPEKITATIETAKPNANITFALGAAPLSELELLNEMLFPHRPDVTLHVWSANTNKKITNEELSALINMKNVKKLHINGYNNTSLQAIAAMEQLTSLQLAANKMLDISFLENFSNLSSLRLAGKFATLQPISNCKTLQEIYLSTTIQSFNFLKPLHQVQKLYVDDCMASNDFDFFNQPALTQLSITAIKMLENVNALANFEQLHSLTLAAPKVATLPNLSQLKNLKKLELKSMKMWNNPEVLQTLPSLEALELMEINTQLKAEQFYSLSEINTLTTLDYRFMDFNKSRIEKIHTFFKDKGKEHIVIK